MKEKIDKYLKDKYMGNTPVYNIQYELEEGYEFGDKKVFGKIGFGIKKIEE